MEKSTVYFTDFRCSVGTSQLAKLKKLCVAAGIKNIDMDGKFVDGIAACRIVSENCSYNPPRSNSNKYLYSMCSQMEPFSSHPGVNAAARPSSSSDISSA